MNAYCVRCGGALNGGARFCAGCGAEVSATGTLSAVAVQPSPVSFESAQQPAAASSASTLLPPPPPQTVLAGRTIEDKYRLGDKIAAGGMGTVYRAERLMIGDTVAIKILHPEHVADATATERFRREAQAAARLKHQNAVQIYDFGVTDDGLVYLVMELVEGQSLRQIIREQGPLMPSAAAEVLRQSCAAIDEAHRQSIIHRDIKPDNIIVSISGSSFRVKVLDFGIAKLAAIEGGNPHDTLTGAGVMIGTPRYMSPEQCESAPLTPASDVYSMGVILYELLTGQTPFTGATPLSLALKHSSEKPRPPRELVTSIPPALEEVVLHALEKKPDDRPSDAGVFRRELYAVAERLGLEHADGFSAPTVTMLREAGTTTSSGRLVLDIELMRRNRAAHVTGRAGQVTGESDFSDTAGGETIQTGGGPAPQAAALSATGKTSRAGAADQPANAVLFSRRAGQAWASWLKQPPVLVAAVVLALLLISGGYAAWRAMRTPASAGASLPASEGDEAIGRSIAQTETAPRGSAYPEPKTAAEFYENGTYFFSIRSYDAAVRDFRRAVELQPEFPSAYNRLGRALMMKGQFGDAAQEFRTAIKQKGGNYPTAHYNLGFALQQQGDWEKAVAAYYDAIKSRGGNYPDAYFQIGNILRAIPERRPEAVSALRKAIEQTGGRDPDAHHVLGVALAEQKDYANAEVAMKEAISLRGGDFAYAHYNLGHLYETTDRPAEAIHEYEIFLRQAPRDGNRKLVENTLRNLRRRAAREGTEAR